MLLGDIYSNAGKYKEALKQIQDPLNISIEEIKRKQQEQNKNKGRTDFGFGVSQPLPINNLSSGILLW